ncbi:MAG: hypothetical protein ACYDCC_06020 [Actinomycetota bacterium]
MKRLSFIGCAVVLALSGGSSKAAGNSICNGTAPFQSSCQATVTLSRNHAEGLLESTTFTGLGSYSVHGSSGEVNASCIAYPGVATCTGDSGSWPFQDGETITINVSVTGAGDWSFLLS